MKKISHRINVSALAVLLAAWGGYSASATTVVLTSEGLGNGEQILGYYDGGFGSFGTGPGPSYGIQFGADSFAIISADNGGSGAFTGSLAPSPNTGAFYLIGDGVIMNVAAGFTTGFSFFYTSPFYTGSVTVWDGLDGSGNQLASLSLGLTTDTTDTTGLPFDDWLPVGVAFSGTAQSVIFLGEQPNFIIFDDITLGSETPNGVPDGGASALLLGIGLVSVGCFRRFRGMA